MPSRGPRRPGKASEAATELAELRGRLEVLQTGAAAARMAEREARQAEELARRELARMGQQVEILTQRLEQAPASPAPAPGAEKLWAKLEAQRQNSEWLAAKLDKQRRRSARLIAALEAARAEARAAELEAAHAVADARTHRAELELSAAVANDAVGGAPAGRAPGDGALDPRKSFELGRGFQTRGAINAAAAAYRRVGPAMKEFLAQEGPDGDMVSGPDFLIIGAARSGTTWLKKSLAQHPQVFILSGEHHYFSLSSHMPPESYVARLAGPHSHFTRPGIKANVFAPPTQRVYGEKSTTYLYMPDSQIELCAALFPDVRLVCLVRDPMARIWSHLKHLAKAGIKLHRMDEAPPWAQLDELIRQCRYEQHLVRWASHFDPDQMLLVDFDRIAVEPDAVYREIVGHIGAEASSGEADSEKVGGTERLDMPSDVRRRLRAAFEGERFDIPYLRSAMDRAAQSARRREPSGAPPDGRLKTIGS